MANLRPASRGLPGALVAAAWAVTVVVGYSLGGQAMAWAVEGVDFRLVSKAPHWATLLCIAVSCVPGTPRVISSGCTSLASAVRSSLV